MTAEKILEVLLFMPGFLFSLSCHEAAHAYVAYKRGDPTAKMMGRISLSPVPHTDVIGTLVLPIFGLLFGGFLFGWGKPVPINYRNLKSPKTDGMWIALAGPVSNFVLAVLFSFAIRAFAAAVPSLSANFGHEYAMVMVFQALQNIFVLNLALCFFNLIPIQPLDGSKILFGLLPNEQAYRIDAFTSRYGTLILLLLILTGALRLILWPPIVLFAKLLLG